MNTTSATRLTNTGMENCFINICLDVRRHANTGPIPVKNSNANPMGILTWLKKGAPTVIFVPRTASVNTGNMVPHNTAKHITMNITLLKRKPLSRDTNDSIRFLVRNNGNRLYNNRNDPAKIKNTNPRNNGPKDEAVKECTEDMIPLRVRKVPKMLSAKVIMIKIIFQTRNISRFSWIMIE